MILLLPLILSTLVTLCVGVQFSIFEDQSDTATLPKRIGNFSRLEERQDTMTDFLKQPIKFQEDKTETIHKMLIISKQDTKFNDDQTETMSKISSTTAQKSEFQENTENKLPFQLPPMDDSFQFFLQTPPKDGEMDDDDDDLNDDDLLEEALLDNNRTNNNDVTIVLKNRKMIRFLIDSYKKNAFLWDQRHPKFRCRMKRAHFLSMIVNEFKRKFNITLARDAVTRKWENLRTVYKRECNRMSKEQTNVSTLWYFKELHFLNYPYGGNQHVAESVVQETTYRRSSLWNEVSNNKLLYLVSQYPCFWDKYNIDYRSKKRRGEALQCIVLELQSLLQVSPKQISKRMSQLRFDYSKQKQERFICEQNNKTFIPNFTYYEQMQFMDHDILPFKCEFCGLIFQTTRESEDHLETHNVAHGYVCSVCHMSFSEVDQFYRHKRTHLVKELKYHCEMCAASFKEKAHFNEHMRRHTNDMRFPCNECGKRFGNSIDLKLHMRSHIEKKPFPPKSSNPQAVPTSKRSFQHIPNTPYVQATKIKCAYNTPKLGVNFAQNPHDSYDLCNFSKAAGSQPIQQPHVAELKNARTQKSVTSMKNIQEKSLHIKDEFSPIHDNSYEKSNDIPKPPSVRNLVQLKPSSSVLTGVSEQNNVKNSRRSPSLNVDDDDDNEMSVYIVESPKTPKIKRHIWNESEEDCSSHGDYVHRATDMNVTYQITDLVNADNVNPFCSDLINALLDQIYFTNFIDDLPNCELIRTVNQLHKDSIVKVNDVSFKVNNIIGEGSYGVIYCVTQKTTGKKYALKQERPPNYWEYYICLEVKSRLQIDELVPAFMDIDYALIGNNSSIYISKLSPYGSILSVRNKIKKVTTKNVDEYVTMHITCLLLDIMDHLHALEIIHADIKADNFLLMEKLSYEGNQQSIQLIDFGVSIDMRLFKKGQSFSYVHKDSAIRCVEMRENRQWTYQIDLFGLAGVIHVLLFGKYMDVFKNPNGVWMHKTRVPRYINKNLWDTIFTTLLNIRDCGSMPKLQKLRVMLKEELANRGSTVSSKIFEFNRALDY